MATNTATMIEEAMRARIITIGTVIATMPIGIKQHTDSKTVAMLTTSLELVAEITRRITSAS